jgi:putative SOS response-associated peptidase YedK
VTVYVFSLSLRDVELILAERGIVVTHECIRHLDRLKWGLLPYWTKEPTRAQRQINARSETAAKSAMFRPALAQRRCLGPVDGFNQHQPAGKTDDG